MGTWDNPVVFRKDASEEYWERWTVKIRCKAQTWWAALYRWDCATVGVEIESIPLTGFWADPAMWFKPMEVRAAKARANLLAYGAELDAKAQAIAELTKRLNNVTGQQKGGSA